MYVLFGVLRVGRTLTMKKKKKNFCDETFLLMALRQQFRLRSVVFKHKRYSIGTFVRARP